MLLATRDGDALICHHATNVSCGGDHRRVGHWMWGQAGESAQGGDSAPFDRERSSLVVLSSLTSGCNYPRRYLVACRQTKEQKARLDKIEKNQLNEHFNSKSSSVSWFCCS